MSARPIPSSRRNLRQTLNLLEEQLHPAGVAVWFADEELLSSSERHWDQLVDEAKAAESWLRKHRRRVREGLAAKLATKRDPGGRPGFGFRRNDAKLIEPDPALASQVRRVFELAAARLTDRQVAEQTELGLYVVRGMLTNPLYAGRLRDGRATAFPPLLPPALFEQVQAMRDLRRTRDRRPAIRRHYALSILRCAACTKRLIGDTGRYRHPDPCADFVAAGGVPRPRRGRHSHGASFSYRAAEYEAVVTSVLAEIELGADVLAEVMVSAPEAPAADRMALARIEREREAVLDRYRRTGDTAELETAMARLDADENGARALGFRRSPEPPHTLEIMPDQMATAVGLFGRYALGTVSAKQLEAETGLAETRIRMILMNPLYNGWIRRKRGAGETRKPAAWRSDPPVSDELWARVEEVRRGKTRGGGPRHRGEQDLLRGLLECVCGRRVRSDGRIGNSERIAKLHPQPCAAWGSQARIAAGT